MTYPLIGNYGVNTGTWNPGGPTSPVRHPRVVARREQLARGFSLAAISQKNGIPGIQGIDTRP